MEEAIGEELPPASCRLLFSSCLLTNSAALVRRAASSSLAFLFAFSSSSRSSRISANLLDLHPIGDRVHKRGADAHAPRYTAAQQSQPKSVRLRGGRSGTKNFFFNPFRLDSRAR